MAPEQTKTSPDRKYTNHAAIDTDDLTSTTSDALSTRTQEGDSGHERLLRHTASMDAKAIPHSRPSNPPHYLVLALLVTPINLPFGLIAVVFSLLSKRSYRNNEFEEARSRGNISKWLSMVGLAVGSVLMGFALVWFALIEKNIVDTPEELRAAT